MLARTPSPLRVRDWPLAVKIAVLFALSWTILATVLTTMGVLEGEHGLREQAERALASDGQQVATSIDDWHDLHLKAVLGVAKVPAIYKVMADPAQREVVGQVVNDSLRTASATYSDTGSFGVIGLDGLFHFSSDQGDFENTTAWQRDFFREALVRDSYISGVQGSANSTDLGRIYYSAPVRSPSGQVVAVLRARAKLDVVQQIIEAARDRIGQGATGVLLDQQGLVIASAVDPSTVLRPVVELPAEVVPALVNAKRFGGGGPPAALNDQDLAAVVGATSNTSFTWHLNGESYAAVAVPLHQTRWTYVAALPVATLEAPVRAFVRNAVITAVLGLLLTSVIAYLFAKPIVGAIASLTRAARGLADGDLDQYVEVESEDELGQMARAFRSMVNYQQTMARLADAVAAGDLSTDVAPKSEHDRLGMALRGMVGNLRQLVGRLEDLAYRDALTGLPNRAHFTERLDQALVAARAKHSALALLFLDLDNFKFVNDTLGHAAGDQLLVHVAQRLEACLDDTDNIVARLGGDEFTVTLENLASPDCATALAERIADALALPMRIDGHTVDVTASIGIAVRTEQQSAGELLQAADLALYAAKAAGKARWATFDPSMSAAALGRLELEADLRLALETGQFEVHYQPLIQLSDGRVSELEALVRWRHPRRGLVGPADFIPIAEETGLIVPIGEWVLETAARQTRVRQAAQAPDETPLMISVNVSARQLQSPGLVDTVRATLEQTGLDPQTLKLEITESVAVADTEANRATLWALRRLGLHLVIDDFGTGNSALNYLRTFPVDGLKIDRSYVEDVCQDRRTTAMVGGMIGFAKALGLGVVGEGIETPQQAALLSELGCDRGQGYLFAKPLTASAVTEMLSAPPSEPELRAA
jgi:diguanylate cyclase (GGDEF)-like protein